ncbi:MAG: carbon-nitrogen family hydrolase [Verrucomicrobiaceae bacterium]|nr:carbon-nitrogen family hydrolase [Verrucomicrobiaceae bacterium]
MKTAVHLVQLDCAWEDKTANFARVRAMLDEEQPDAGALVVLPEMFATGFSMDTEATRQGDDRETESFLRGLALKHQCCVIGGAVTADAEGKCRNEALVFDPEGRELARYAKMRPFALGEEDKVHERGTQVCVFEWCGLKIAPFICYDLRFPELAREAVVRCGAEVLVYIASWPVKRHQHWLALLQARAIENLACVIGVNRCGQDPFFTHVGRSIVVDPHGVVTADAGSHEKILRAVIEHDSVRDWRAHFPALTDAGPWPSACAP